MIKAFSFLFVAFIAIIAFPVCIGLAAGAFGLIFGLIGGAIGLVFGIIGAVLGAIASVIRAIFHSIFGWHQHWDYHPWHSHSNGFLILAIIVLIVVLVSRNKK